MLQELVLRLKDKYPQEEIAEAYGELMQLKEAGQLFTTDAYEDVIFDFKNRQTVVKALCLHIAHDCNLACRYCFAEEGEYHGRRALMSYEVGRAGFFNCKFRQQAQPGGRLFWRRTDLEPGGCQTAGSVWKAAGKAA